MLNEEVIRFKKKTKQLFLTTDFVTNAKVQHKTGDLRKLSKIISFIELQILS